MSKCGAVAVGRPLATSRDVEGCRHPVRVPHVLACSPTIGHLVRPHRRELIRRRTSHGFEVPIGYACRLVRVRFDPPPVSGGVPRNQATFPGTGWRHLAAREVISSGALQQEISLSYKKTLNDASTRTPEQQRAAEVGNKYAGGKPKASADQIGVQPDDARLQREEQPRKQSVDR
jgi:hypothetical protein